MIDFIDFGEYQTIAFDVVCLDNSYNLHFVIYKLSDEKLVTEILMYRTAIFTEDIKSMSKKIKDIIEFGIFDNLRYIAGGKILDAECNFVENIDWNEYFENKYSTNFIN